jgi:branched-chain amino acid transport system permease protein
VSAFLEYLSFGLQQGAVYAFIALGYTMVYGIIRLINFAHGEVFMVGAFAGYAALRWGGLDLLPLPEPWPVVVAYLGALLAGALASGLLALAIERFCYRPVRRAGRIAALLTAVGLSLLLQNVMRQAAGPDTRPYPAPRVFVAEVPEPADATYFRREVRTFGGEEVEREVELVARGGRLDPDERAALAAEPSPVAYRKAEISPGAAKLVILAMLVVASIGLWFVVHRTRTGRAMRAVSEDLAAAQLMGVPVDRVVAATFFLGAVLAGAGGVAYSATYGNVHPLVGFLPGLKAFVAAVLGGIGSIPGAVLGGVTLGVAENLFGAYVSTQWKDALAFGLLVLVLLVRPTGVLGRARREKV